MSHRSNRAFQAMGPLDPQYALYEDSFRQPLPRRSESLTHFDGMTFWYRSEPQEPIFEHNGLLYNQGLTIATSPVDQPMNIKHRRTRSGCFTCRHRRVKCDETRPICERCRKGNRECHFPQPSSSSRRIDANDPRGSHGKASGADTKVEPSRALPPVEDESEEERGESLSPASGPSRSGIDGVRTNIPQPIDAERSLRSKSDAADIMEEQESPASVGEESQRSRSRTPASISLTPPAETKQSSACSRWKHLDMAAQRYLQYHHDHVSHYHYFLRDDPEDFIHSELIDIALSFEPLMHAIIGFTAYHYTLNQPDGRFQEFWKYYCQSIMLLRKWLESHTERHEAALLTILQLATFEEYLGDWVSVASHQRAAYSIFNALYTPENVMATTASRCVFDWLARADISLSLMSGACTVLERKWFVAGLSWHQSLFASKDLDPSTALPYFVAKLQLVSADMATVFADRSIDTTAVQALQSISTRMEDLRAEIQDFHDVSRLKRSPSRSNERTNTPEPGRDPWIPFFDGSLFRLNFVLIDWYATEQMRKYQTMLFTTTAQSKKSSRTMSTGNVTSSPNQGILVLPADLEKLSMIHCRLFEVIERSSTAPAEAVIGCQAALALAAVFLGKSAKHNMWARRKLAKIERMGYIWPPSFRKRMAQLWNNDDILDWWLPNGEHKIELLNEIRDVVEERNKEIEGRGGDEKDDVREIKAVFDKLDFGKRVTRRRKDSVWSATDAEEKVTGKVNSAVDLEQDDDDDKDDHVLAGNEKDADSIHPKHAPIWSHRREESRDSGVGANSTDNTTKGRSQPILEYSNRMSGIWEGPIYGGQ